MGIDIIFFRVSDKYTSILNRLFQRNYEHHFGEQITFIPVYSMNGCIF